MSRRVLLASEYNAWNHAFHSLSYEFCQVIAAVDDVQLVVPPQSQRRMERVARKAANLIGEPLGLRRIAVSDRVHLAQDYELFLFVCWSPDSFVELSRIKHWRERCRKTAVFINEIWSHNIHKYDAYLSALRNFDYVFTPHKPTIPQLQKHTNGRCVFLPQGANCLRSSPFPERPARVLDVYSYGHRPAAVHRQLVALAEQQEIFYQYDSLASSDSRVKSWSEHRLLLANNIKRSRYVLTFNPSAGTLKARDANGEQVLSARLFEGAAGGAAMIGSAPKCAEFTENFDWPDAVIEMPPNCDDVASFIRKLDVDATRLERVRTTNAVQSLRRHDWVYRWETILNTVGMTPTSKVNHRKAQLWSLAKAAEQPVVRDGRVRLEASAAAE
jgi:hypothetical protein